MRAWGVLAIGGVALVAGGLVFGLSPVQAEGVRCGSAFAASEYGGNPFLGGGVCDGPRSQQRVPAVALLVMGGVLTVGGVAAGVAAQEPYVQPENAPST